MNVDAWQRNRWYDEFEENQVIVATCQIVLDIIRHNYISFNYMNLIIFDECHHARGNHSMHQLMSRFQQTVGHRPRIIGLTGMLLSGSVKVNTVVPDLCKLESTFHATIATVGSTAEFNNVLVYSTNPNERLIKFSDFAIVQHKKIAVQIQEIVAIYMQKIKKWPVEVTKCSASMEFKIKGELVKIAKQLSSLWNDFLFQLNHMGVYGASIAILSVIVELELKKKTCDTTLKRQLVRECICGAELIRHLLVLHMGDPDEEDRSIIMEHLSPKMVSLITFLTKYTSECNVTEMKALIFVKRRHTAKCLYHVLKRYAASTTDFPILPDFMVGNNSTLAESIEAILDNKWNRLVIDRFRKSDINLIVASSVLEEGIDLQMCNLVLSFDEPDSFRSYIQRKGRARMSTSTYATLVSDNEASKFLAKCVEYRQIDQVLRQYLIGKTIDRPEPSVSDISREFANIHIVPFKTPKGATLEALSAVPLINRYCMTLPNDHFSRSTVLWTLVSSSDQFIVQLRMPMQSKVKGDIMVSWKHF